ncbi:hypothetical protein NVIE_025890 [Nitrososphaera viennensis EN76]|uniref:Uncharacterized protein n=1 Tax=Nitrososphaera viennensis EN76 TaxID=926571 RepID=A0A060HP04_9ARCH|nr:hypothetical protein NVIE_025890 [Nitrososphaera viennensis EN76]
MSFNFVTYCEVCRLDRQFTLYHSEVRVNGQMYMHGTCVVCNNKAVKNMGECIWIKARCPKCNEEITIATFDGDPTENLKRCSTCSYSGLLDVIRVTRGWEPIY